VKAEGNTDIWRMEDINIQSNSFRYLLRLPWGDVHGVFAVVQTTILEMLDGWLEMAATAPNPIRLHLAIKIAGRKG
jgi:hypothetical protein